MMEMHRLDLMTAVYKWFKSLCGTSRLGEMVGSRNLKVSMLDTELLDIVRGSISQDKFVVQVEFI